MGQIGQAAAADRYGLARVDRERRWTSIMNAVMLLAGIGWVSALTLSTPGPAVRAVATAVLLAMVMHRLALLVEHLRRRRRTALVVAVPVDQVASSS